MSAPASPTFVNRNAIFAERAASRKSEASAITAPAPAATPFRTASTGCGARRMALIRAHVMRVNARSSGPVILRSGPMMSSTSPPEQKPEPSPVIEIARTSFRPGMDSKSSVSSR